MSDKAADQNVGLVVQPISSSKHPKLQDEVEVDSREICESSNFLVIKDEDLMEFDPHDIFPDLVNCVLCSRQGTVKEILEHVLKYHQLLCRVCGIDFKQRLNFTKHKSQHNLGNIQFFNCLECKVEFKTIDLVKTHYTKEHPHKLNSCNKMKIYSRVIRKNLKPSPPGDSSLDCPFCEARVLLEDFHHHLSSHTISSCCKCSSTLIDMNSTSQLCVVCSQILHPEPRIQTTVRKFLKKMPDDLTCFKNHCKVCETPIQGPPQSLCAVCKLAKRRVPPTLILSLSLSEFSECETSCEDCKARLWRYKYIQICLNCLPRDVASLDINLRILPKSAVEIEPEKCGDGPMETSVNIASIKSTDEVSVNSEPEVGEPTPDIFSMDPQSPESETNPDSVDFDDELSSEPPWIETAPDAVWSSEPAVLALTPCDYCPEMFLTCKLTRRHMKRSHPDYLKKICACCSTQFTNWGSFYNHRAINRSGLGFLCEICGEKHSIITALNRHKTRKHETSNDVLCPICQKNFRHKLALREHIYTIHKERKYHCAHCRKKFVYRSDIESHMQTHTRVYLFRCKLCRAKYNRADNLRQHMKYNHNFACPICDLTLPTAAEVRRHRGEAHTREQLEASQAQGEGEFVRFTPFQCEVCSRFLASQQSLDKHLTTHTRTDKKTSNRKPTEGGIAREEAVVEHETHKYVKSENIKRKSDQTKLENVAS